MSGKITITTPFEVGPSAPNPFIEEYGNVPAAILIVDSEEINRRLLKAIFKTAPYRILEARKASEAQALLQSERVDLVILDLMLPEMSGPDLADRLVEHRPDLIVLYISGYTDDDAVRAGAIPLGSKFLQKPFTLDTVIRRTFGKFSIRRNASS